MTPAEPSELARKLLPALRVVFGKDVQLDQISGAVASFQLPGSAPDGPLELRVPWSTDSESSALFLAELGILRRLRHPNVVGLVREGIVEGRPYYVLPRSHPTLDDRLGHDRRLKNPLLPVAELIVVLRDIAAALAYCHRNGVVHAEVDPRHIAFDRKRAALFGFERAASFAVFGCGREGIILGNPTYFSPELCLGQPLDGRSDIYSLGVTAYECLAGQPPFLGDWDGVRARLEQEPPTPKLRSADEEDVYAVIRRMLAADPMARYPSAEALLSAVEHL